jgi:hypothetical protein
MAVHPNGTVFVLTKDLLGQSAGLYRLRPQQWKNAGGKAQTLEHVITLDLAKLRPGLLFLRRVPTAMDMSSDGKHLLVLMYVDAVEINLDFSAATIPPVSEWREGHTYRSIPIAQLQQQESVAYAPGGRAFFYTTERGSGRNPLMRVDCVRD